MLSTGFIEIEQIQFQHNLLKLNEYNFNMIIEIEQIQFQ